MTNLEQPVRIDVFHRDTAATHYIFQTSGGEMTTSHIERCGWYTITNVDVWAPRTGVGKLLLRSGLVHARLLGSERVMASITSRNLIDSATEVFGDESVSITEFGTYQDQQIGAPRYDASAYLLKYLT